jgi:glycerophosphoryl diester phosphodiesterase
VVQQRLASKLDPPITFAHRGARAHAPENTLEAFDLALRLGASGLESDVWLTADGVPVLDHDGVVRRRLGRNQPIAEVTRAALPAHIPSLAELLEALEQPCSLSLDLKNVAAGQRVIDVTREVRPEMVERLWLCAPSWPTLLALRGQGARLVDSTRLQRIKEGPERRAATLHAEGIDAINMHHSDWNGGLVALMHRFDLVAFGWDMQDEFSLRPALRMGLDGVYSDWVDRMVDAFRAEIGGPAAGWSAV